MVAKMWIMIEEEKAGQMIEGGVRILALNRDKSLQDSLEHGVLFVPGETESGDRGE